MKWKNFLSEVFHRTLGTTLTGKTGATTSKMHASTRWELAFMDEEF